MTLTQIKALFKTGAIPTQSDFESLIDKIPNNEGEGDKTVNVETPNKPFIQGIRTIVDRTEGYTYVALLGLYDEAMQGDFDGAYRYPSIVLRFQCESSSVPPDGTIVQYAFGQYDDFDWDVDIVDDTARLSLEGLTWKTINFSHEVIRKSLFNNTEGYYHTYIFETEIFNDSNNYYNIPYQVTEIRVSGGDDMVTHSYIYKITENVTLEDLNNWWLGIKYQTGFSPYEIADGLGQFYYNITR